MSPPAEILADRWQLIEKIDAGAMGEIFRGAHHLLGHAVAIKVLMPEIARDKAAIERFLREARIAARLQHRNVVRVEDFGVAGDGRPFLVMELLRGESLAKRLERSPRLRNGEVLSVVRQIGAALDVAHGAGIIHRDLKPENIFLTEDEAGGYSVKVLDFGVAKFTDVLANGGHATTSNTLVGTPRYMSPEQARSSKELDGRSDLWALGMLTYEMLTCTHPFEGEAIAELLVAILTHRIPSPSSVRQDLPEAVDVWMERALARNRSERFASGKELSRALEEALDGRMDGAWAASFVDVQPRREDTARRGGTVRIQRPSTYTPIPEPAAEEKPVEAPPPVDPVDIPLAALDRVTKTPPPAVVEVRPRTSADETPRQGITVSPRTTNRDQPLPAGIPAPVRVSWRMAGFVGLLAAVGLIVATRSATTARERTARPSHSPVVAFQSPPLVLPSPPPVVEQEPQTAQEPVPPVTTAPSADAGVTVVESRLSERGRHHRHRNERHRTDGGTSASGGLYDPTGI